MSLVKFSPVTTSWKRSSFYFALSLSATTLSSAMKAKPLSGLVVLAPVNKDSCLLQPNTKTARPRAVKITQTTKLEVSSTKSKQ